MALKDLLIHRCTVRRKTEGAADGYGEPAITWADLATAALCRLTQPRGTTRHPVTGEFVERFPTLYITTAVTITEHDRIVMTTGPTGTFDILKVRWYYDADELHHFELDLQEVAS
jgi:hypothetical protein